MMSLRGAKIFTFDVDGVLVDSYSCLPAIYTEIGRRLGIPDKELDRFVSRMIELEDINDFHHNYGKTWWRQAFKEFGKTLTSSEFENLYSWFQNERIARSPVIPAARKFLNFLVRRNKIKVILCGWDGVPGMKMKRIKGAGLDAYFNDFLIVGENIKERKDAFPYLERKYDVNPGEIVVIDDKPEPLMIAKRAGAITVQVKFEGPLKLAWSVDFKPDIFVQSLENLVRLL